MATTRVQTDFRFRNDDGSQSAASWIAAAHVNITPLVTSANKKLRLRIVVRQTGTTAATHTQRLYVSKNGGAYAQITNGGTSGVKIVDSANLTDDAATTQQLSAGTFVAGKQDDVNGQTGATGSMAQNRDTEHEYMLQLDFANLTGGDYFDFRAYQTTSALNTYTYTARITINKAQAMVLSEDATVNEATQKKTKKICSDSSSLSDTLSKEQKLPDVPQLKRVRYNLRNNL